MQQSAMQALARPPVCRTHGRWGLVGVLLWAQALLVPFFAFWHGTPIVRAVVLGGLLATGASAVSVLTVPEGIRALAAWVCAHVSATVIAVSLGAPQVVQFLLVAPMLTGFLATRRMCEFELSRRVRAENELRDALSVLSASLEATADGILVVDDAGRMTCFNQRFLEMWRIPPQVVAARDDERALQFVLDQLEDPDEFLQRVQDLYGHADACSFDELRFKDGRTFERYSQPQRVSETIVGRVWSFRDVTDRKLTEAALHEALRRERDVVARLQRDVETAEGLEIASRSAVSPGTG